MFENFGSWLLGTGVGSFDANAGANPAAGAATATVVTNNSTGTSSVSRGVWGLLSSALTTAGNAFGVVTQTDAQKRNAAAAATISTNSSRTMILLGGAALLTIVLFILIFLRRRG